MLQLLQLRTDIFTDKTSLMLSFTAIVTSYWCRCWRKFSCKEKGTIIVIHIDEKFVMGICTCFVTPVLVPF